jgi:hypothetical protein
MSFFAKSIHCHASEKLQKYVKKYLLRNASPYGCIKMKMCAAKYMRRKVSPELRMASWISAQITSISGYGA